MADTLVPADWPVQMARGDTFEGTVDVAEGPTEAAAVPVDLSARTYRLTVRHTSTDAVLAAVSETPSVSGVITRNADGVTGRLRWKVEESVTAAWPVDTLKWDLEETAAGDVQTLIAGTITVAEDQSR